MRRTMPRGLRLPGDIAVAIEGADLSLDAEIEEAAEACPVEAIKFER